MMSIGIEKFTVPNLMTNLCMSYYGHEQCSSGQRYGPAVRDHYLYVFIVKGRGIYKVKGLEYPLKQGQAFILFPNELTQYQADAHDPWEYMWFGFNGNLVHDVLQQSGIHTSEPVLSHLHPERVHRLFGDLLDYETKNNPVDELFYTGNLNAILFEICGERARMIPTDNLNGDTYVTQAHSFLKQHYDKEIHIGDVARYVGLERSYFTKMFKLKTGVSPYQYLMDLRFAKAKQLLLETDLLVEHIAPLIGLKDTFHFSGFFKKKAGCSPMYFRKRAANSNNRVVVQVKNK
jgi:AraC-like DNA-binding protein